MDRLLACLVCVGGGGGGGEEGGETERDTYIEKHDPSDIQVFPAYFLHF